MFTQIRKLFAFSVKLVRMQIQGLALSLTVGGIFELLKLALL